MKYTSSGLFNVYNDNKKKQAQVPGVARGISLKKFRILKEKKIEEKNLILDFEKIFSLWAIAIAIANI